MFPSAPSRGRWRGRECKGETRARASDVSCTAQSLRMFVGEKRRKGSVFHPCQSYPLSQSTPATSTSIHSSSGTLAVISPSSQDFSQSRPSLPALSVTFFVLWALWFMDGHRKQCVRVIARLRSRLRRGTSIRRPAAVTEISINFFFLSWSLRCFSTQPKATRTVGDNQHKYNRVRLKRRGSVCLLKPSRDILAVGLCDRKLNSNAFSRACIRLDSSLPLKGVWVPASYRQQSPLCFFAHSGAPSPPVTPSKLPALTVVRANPLICPWRVQWGCTDPHWRLWRGDRGGGNGAPVVTVNLSVHPPACSPVFLFFPFGNHSTWFGQLPHVHSSPRRCLNSSSSHLSCDGLRGMLQPPPGPSTVIRCSEFCWQPIKKSCTLSLCVCVCVKVC